jgi:tRNA(fMet)-specific endonuclease VapC
MRLILDTDVITIIQRRTEPAYSHLVSRLKDATNDEVWTTIISFEEQMRGWLSLLAANPKEDVVVYSRLSAFLAFFKSVPVLDYTADAAQRFSKIRGLKLRVGTMDLKIASIAISENGLLLSRNLIDFEQVPGLQVEDWTIP